MKKNKIIDYIHELIIYYLSSHFVINHLTYESQYQHNQKLTNLVKNHHFSTFCTFSEYIPIKSYSNIVYISYFIKFFKNHFSIRTFLHCAKPCR